MQPCRSATLIRIVKSPTKITIQGCIHATTGNFQTRTMMQRDREQQRLYGE